MLNGTKRKAVQVGGRDELDVHFDPRQLDAVHSIVLNAFKDEHSTKHEEKRTQPSTGTMKTPVDNTRQG